MSRALTPGYKHVEIIDIAPVGDEPGPSMTPAGLLDIATSTSSHARSPTGIGSIPASASGDTAVEIARLQQMVEEIESDRDRHLAAYQETKAKYQAVQQSNHDLIRAVLSESSDWQQKPESFDQGLDGVPVNTLVSFVIENLGCWVAARALVEIYGETKRFPDMAIIDLESLQSAVRLGNELERVDFFHHWITKMQPMLSSKLHEQVLESTPQQNIDNLENFTKAAMEGRDRLLEQQQALERQRQEQEEIRRKENQARKQKQKQEARDRIRAIDAERTTLFQILDEPLSP